MGVYDFEVLKDGAVIAAEQTIALPDTSAAWPKIAELAKTFDKPGHNIRVKDEAGGIVILIGVLRFAAAPTRSRLASARICKCAYLVPCQNNNDQRSRGETYRGFEECRRAWRRRAPSRPPSHDNGAP
jgi:hypothetical protein